MCNLIQPANCSFDIIPIFLSTSFPSFSKTKVGILITPNSWARGELLSTSTFSNSIFPCNSDTVSSMMLLITRQGPHHVAKKSISLTMENILPKKTPIKKYFAPFLLVLILIIALTTWTKPQKFSKTLENGNKEILYEATFRNEGDKNPQRLSFDLRNSPETATPEVSAQEVLFVDLATNTIIYNKNAQKQVPVASLVKIATAVVAVEHLKLDEKIVVSQKAGTIGENVMGISPGEEYTLEELLYGLVLASGNDTAYAIAEGVAGDAKTFTDWMNRKASDLGLENTKFSEPSGLNPKNKEYYSTAYDLAILTEYALRKPELAEIFATFEYEIFATERHKYIYLQNQTNLLSTYPGAKGVKTGYTEDSGLCLITYVENSGHKILGVILGSLNRRTEGIILLDNAFSKFGITIPHNLL